MLGTRVTLKTRAWGQLCLGYTWKSLGVGYTCTYGTATANRPTLHRRYAATASELTTTVASDRSG